MQCITIATDAHGMPPPNVIGALGAGEDVTAAPGWVLPPQRKRRLSPWEIERSDAELRLAAAVNPQDADAARVMRYAGMNVAGWPVISFGRQACGP